MAKRITFLATLPNGRIATRTSGSKVYTHAVAARRSYDWAIKAANDPRGIQQDIDNFKYYQRELDPTTCKHGYNLEDKAAVVAQYGNPENYAAQRRLEALARIEAAKAEGVFDAWDAVTWASRYDLAAKQTGKYQGGYWAECRVVEVSVK